MIKKYNSTGTLLFILVFFLSFETQAQSFQDLDDVPHDISYLRENRATAPKVKVLYGRPKMKGKEVFGTLIPYGKLWRTGANEATEIKFYEEVEFGGKKVSPGTYVLLTIPGKNEWEIILNSKTDVLGAFQYDPEYDIARIKVPVKKAETLETFSIAFKRAENSQFQMVLAWDATRVKIPLQFKEENVALNR